MILGATIPEWSVSFSLAVLLAGWWWAPACTPEQAHACTVLVLLALLVVLLCGAWWGVLGLYRDDAGGFAVRLGALVLGLQAQGPVRGAALGLGDFAFAVRARMDPVEVYQGPALPGLLTLTAGPFRLAVPNRLHSPEA